MEGVATTRNEEHGQPHGHAGRQQTQHAPIKPARPRPPRHLRKTFRTLMAGLRSSDVPVLKAHAIFWLYQTQHPKLVDMVLDELEADRYSRDRKVREKALGLLTILNCRMLGVSPPRLSLDMLVKCLRSPNPELRRQAAELIGDRGKVAKPALGALREALTDSDPEVQFRVAVAIGMITGRLPPKPGTAATTGTEQAAGQGTREVKEG